MKWLTQNAESNAMLAVLVAPHIVYVTKSMWLRDDLVFLRHYRGNFNPEEKLILYEFYKRPQKPLYAMYITNRGWYTDFVNLLENKYKPVYTITADGAPILKIFKIVSMDATMAKAMGLTDTRDSAGSVSP